MKKLGLMSAGLLSVVLLAGCNSNKAEVTGYEGMMDLYNTEGKMTCTINIADEEDGTLDGTMYIDGENYYVEEHVTYNDESASIYSLTVDGKNYTRGDLYGEGIGLVIDATQTTRDLLESMDFEDEGIQFTCKSGIKADKFEVPSDVEFTSFEELVSLEENLNVEGEEVIENESEEIQLEETQEPVADPLAEEVIEENAEEVTE